MTTELCLVNRAKTVPAVEKKCWKVRKIYRNWRRVKLSLVVESVILEMPLDVQVVHFWASQPSNLETK